MLNRIRTMLATSREMLRLLAMVFMLSGLLAGGASAASSAAALPTSGPASETTPEGIGLQAASVLTSILYLPFKGVMALTGGLAGGIAYLFSAGNMDVAEAVWGPSVYGTYLITPDHLTGRKPVQFFGSLPPNTSRH